MNIYTISFLIILFFNFIKNKRSLHYLQLNIYNENNRYINWIVNNLKSIFLSIDLLALITILIAYLINTDLSRILLVIALVFYFLESARLINNYRCENIKPFIVTKRVRRLIATTSILFLLPIIIYLINHDNQLLMLLVESTLTYLSYYVVLVAKIINTPIENLVDKYYEVKAINKLKSMKNLKTIAISGSYGKTSSKRILDDILSQNFVTMSTPKAINTEYGLMLTINNIEKNTEVYIAELGNYKKGRVTKMCSVLKPKYAILTNVGINDLEAFGNSENAIKSKFELIESLDSKGVAVLNKDDPKQVSYKIKSKCKKIWIGIDNEKADINATDIKVDYKGSKFNVTFKGDSKKYQFETKLLGKYNIYNVLASIAVTKELGIKIEDIIKKVKNIRQIESRLELKEYDYMYQLDDSKNTNPIGAKVALEVLKMMPGNKVVVTPGISSSDKEKLYNQIYGNQIARINPDVVILVGDVHSKAIFKGLKDSNYDRDKIYVVKRIDDAYNLIQKLNFDKKVYALFENDIN